MRHSFLSPRGDSLEIVVNGVLREVANRLSIVALLDELRVPGRGVAVEVNFEVVPRAQHSQFLLNAGDRVEVVSLVGGG
jgi:sulfur carrier protein